MQYSKDKTLLSVHDVSHSFDGVKVLDNINMEIKDLLIPGTTTGQIVSLIGRSGSGKTTLLRILAGLLRPTEGHIMVGLEQRDMHTGDMGLVSQNYFVFPWRTVIGNLTIAAGKNAKLKTAQEVKDSVEGYMAAFEITELATKYPCQLSGGQRQRLCIAMQLLNGSDFLLMDEPFSGLDSIMIDKTTELLRRVAQGNELITIIIVSHDLVNSIAISDEIFLLSKKGRKPEEGATIVKSIDLMVRDLAWHADIKRMPAFHDTIEEVKTLF